MKWLIAAALWMIAAGLTVVVIYRLTRGRNVLLRGKWSPRVVRMVVLALFVLGVAPTSLMGQSAPQKSPSSQPAKYPEKTIPLWFDVDSLQHWSWRAAHPEQVNQHKRELEKLRRQSVVSVSTFKALMPQLLMQMRPIEFAESTLELQVVSLISLVRDDYVTVLRWPTDVQSRPGELEYRLGDAIRFLGSEGLFDDWWVALIWSRLERLPISDAARTSGLMIEFAEYVRVTNAITMAKNSGRMHEPHAWTTKAGTSGGKYPLFSEEASRNFIAVVDCFQSCDLGRWQRDATVELTVSDRTLGWISIFRNGAEQRLTPRDTVRLNRFDLLSVRDTEFFELDHNWLGAVRFATTSQFMTMWEYPDHLSPEQLKLIADAVAESLSGDEAAAAKLEDALPFTYRALREALRANPKSLGAPRLRMILAQFDELSVPASE